MLRGNGGGLGQEGKKFEGGREGHREQGKFGGRMMSEEKYSRRLEKFEGDVTKFRGWMFDMGVAIGFVDKGLSEEFHILAKYEDGDRWNPDNDGRLSRDIYEKYQAELYGLLCSVAQGEAKTLVRGDLGLRTWS